MKFNISAAREAGYSDDEIAQYLATENKFDLSGALKSGYSPSEVIEFLSSKEQPAPAASPAPAAPERGLIDRVADWFKPAPKSVMENYQPTPQDRQADVDRRLSYGAGPISSETAAKADLVRSGMAKPDSKVVERTAKGMERVKAPSFGELVDRAKVAGEELDRQNSGLNLSLVPEQFKSGVAGMQQGFFTSVAKNNAALLNIMDRIDAGEKIVPADDPLGYQDMSPDQRAKTRAQIESALPKNIANVISYGQEQQQYAKNPLADELVKKANDGDYKGALKVFATDPLGILQQLSVQSAPNALPSLVGGAAGVLMRGGVGGMMAGLATGSFPVEYMASLTESLQNSGVDLSDAKAVEAKLRDPKFLEDAGKRAVTRGTVIAAADAASGKLLLPLRGGQLGRNAARGVANVAIETGTEMGGEAGAQIFSGEQVRVGDVLAEGLGAGPQAVGTTALKTVNETLAPRTLDFTPADSPSAQAGLAPIVVPEPTASVQVPQVNPQTEQQFGLDQLRMGGTNVGADSLAGTGTGVGGVAGSDQSVGGVGVSGLGVDGAGRVAGGDAGRIATDAGQAVAAGGADVQQPASVAAADNNNAVVEPAQQWFGRKGDGYVTEADANQALPGRQRMFPQLSWSVEQMPNGKYRLAGYENQDAEATVTATGERLPTAGPTTGSVETTGLNARTQETNLGTQTAQAVQAEAQGQEVPAASARQLPDLLDRQSPVPDAVLAEFARNPNAPSSRAAVQTYLDDLVAKGRLPDAPKLGTPDADAETTVSALGRIFGDATGIGNRVVAYKDEGGDNGFALGQIAFINTSLDSTAIDAPKTVLHELRHVAEQLADAGSKSAQEFTLQLDSIFDDMTDEGKRAYVENFLFKEKLAEIADPAARAAAVQKYMQSPQLRSEMVADFLGNRAQDRAFLIDLAKADPKGFEGFVRRWLAVIDNLIKKLRGGKTQNQKESAKVDSYIRDLNKAKMVARDALIQFRKGNLAEQQARAQAQPQAEPVMSPRQSEKIGDFDVRTMKDGTTVVYGDPETIRAQIPADVKGRVTKDGIVFTTSAAPRVKAALEGRKTAYSRAGAVLDKLPMKDGKYIGAPAKFNTPAKIPTLRKLLRQLADEGAPGRYWYENSSREVLKMVGGDVQEARRFVALLAIYSPQAKVDANSTFALRAWAQYKNGQPISVKTGSQDRKATEAMQDVDAFWKGEKTGNFFFNLLREIDPSTQGKQGATIDMWMMRAGQYENDAPTATQYAFMENETNRLAAELGWEPQQVQAAIWVAMKARMENAGVKKRTEASSEKKGWIRYDYPLKNGRPVKTRVIIDAQKHRDNWLKYSFEHDVTKDDTQQAKFDFGDGLKRHIGQVSFEARPGRTTGVLPGIHNAPYAQQVEFQQAVQRAFYDEQGNDQLAMALGLLVDNDILVPGVWQGEVSPSTQLGVAMAPAKGEEGKTSVDPAQAEALNVYAAIAGLVARQEGVGWHRPFYSSTKRDANGLDINIGRTINPAEAKDLEAAVGKWMADNGYDGWQDRFAFISSPTGIRIVNFGIITNEKLQSDILDVAGSVLPNAEARWFASSGDMMTNDWKGKPNGQDYVERASAAGRSDVLDWARAVLAPRVQRVFTEFSDKYGWGNPGELKFSRRDGAGRDQSRSSAPLEGAPIVEGATGPDPRLVQVAEQYARDNGIELRRQAEYVQVDPVRARRIANAYEVMRHAPQDPKVQEAFQNLIRQTVAQYRALEKAGYRFYFFDESNDPYDGNPWNAMRDLRDNQVMGVFATEAGFGSGATDLNVDDNPLLADTGIEWPYGSLDGERKRVLANDLFRAVHDAFGHGLEGAGFRAQGEENAWQAHVRLFTGSAVGAITSETRGQNSWLNYGPYGERNQSARVEDTVFADQKTGLMPEWTWTEGRVGDMPALSKREDRSGISQLSYQGYQIVDTPRVQASRKINGIIKKLDDGKLTPAEFELQVRMLADRMAEATATKDANRILSTRERGADIVREKLLAARRRNEIDPETTEFALWALSQNPAIAEGLGISVREQPANQKGAAGDYNPAAEIMRVFKGKANDGTAVHEILHHTERMMPPAVQDGIRKEWSKAYSKALSKADERQRAALEKILLAMAGDEAAQKIVRDAFSDGTLSADDHYQLVNPSEYWAVNATNILKRRYQAGSWIGQAKQWLSEMMQKVKGLLRLRSDAPILRGLQAVLDGKGQRLSKQMLTDQSMFSDIAETETKESDPEVVRMFTELQDARGLTAVRVKERIADHPMGEQIVKIHNDFYDILERLDDAGLIAINC